MAKVGTRAPDSNRLDANAWTDGALLLLAEEGIDGVRVEVLAKRLGVTKGSFYWHFKDRRALYDAMLSHWRRQATLALIERLDRGEAPARERLVRLLRLPVVGSRSSSAAEVELAIRLWGRRDEAARATLEEVDSLRLAYIQQLLVEMGRDAAQARASAVLAYSYIRVAATLIHKDDEELMESCENILFGV